MRTVILALLLAACGAADEPDDTTDPGGTPTDDPGGCEPVDEIPYDGVDQDCDDADLVDVDDDGFVAVEAGGDDCDDQDAAVHPGAADDLVDGVDADCDGLDGPDADGDGYAASAAGGDDCRDDDPAIHPGAVEIWYDGVDQDCARDCDFDQDGDGLAAEGALVADGGPCDTQPGVGVPSARDCDDTDAAVFNRLLATSPADLAVDVGPAAEIAADFDVFEAGASLELFDAAGAPVAGTAAFDGTSLVFTPDQPLLVGAAYDATATWSCGAETWSFTTQAPVDDVQLPGRTYEIDLQSGTWAQPAGVGPLVGGALVNTALVEILATTPVDIDARFGGGVLGAVPAAQDPCVGTADLLGGDLSANPGFTLGPSTVTLPVLGSLAPIEDAEVTGRFSADLASLVDVAFTGRVDTRPLVPVIGGANPGDVCDLLLALGVACGPCADGGTYCVDLEVTGLSGVEVPLALAPRTAADIAADPACP